MIPRNNFDALRLLGALMVLLSHMAPLSGRQEWMWMGEHSAGNFGVLIFFSISGYLVTGSWKSDPDLGRFLSRRYLRMFPGLAVSVAVAYGLVALLGLTGFHGNPTQKMNGSLWTIEYEVYCYLLLAAAAMVAPRPALVFAAGMVLAYALLPADHLSYFGFFFAAGALLQAYRSYRVWRVAALLVAGGAAVYLSSGNTIIALALALPPIVILVGSQSWPVLRNAGRFGDLSYGVYIYAWPTQQTLVALMPKDSSYLALTAASLAVVLPLAWLSWRYVERPALARKPKHRGVAQENPLGGRRNLQSDSAGGLVASQPSPTPGAGL